MNFLAHIYLSGDDTEVLMGNFIGDSIKGKKRILQFPEQVQKGIIVHREIDSYMDSHPIVKKGMSRLRSKYPKYSGVIIDMFYDHLLAANWSIYSDISLEKYIQYIYNTVEENNHLLVGKAKVMFPAMRENNWLLSYATLEGMESILYQMTYRIKNRVALHDSINELREFYEDYEYEFFDFFDQIMKHLSIKFDIKIK